MQISEVGKWAVIQTNIDPLRIASITGDDENDLWTYMEDVRVELNHLERERQKQLPELHKQVQEFKNELPPEERKEIRLNYLSEKINSETRKFREACVELAERKTDDIKKAEEAENQMLKISREIQIIQGWEIGLTQQEIERAREYPITDLIENRRMMAKCPFHQDKTASMYLKNNFYHCFGCQKSGDVINFVMETKNMTFKEAVNYLQ